MRGKHGRSHPAFSAAGLDPTEVASTLSTIDTDKNGKLNTDELTSAIQQNMDAGYRAYAGSAAVTG